MSEDMYKVHARTRLGASFELGRLYWGDLRDAVSRERFHGSDIRWWEGHGFFSRPFALSGDEDAVMRIARWVSSISATPFVGPRGAAP